ncbi:MAG: ATP-binding protein, partial [Oscillospiraceae bacterium]|nr:ATP-binding protein [Oscillospiraceae bacterium]
LSFSSYAQSIQRKILSVVLPIVDGMVGVVVFSFLLIPTLKMNGLYLANILNGVLCFLVVFSAAWLSLKRVPRNLEDLMVIPADFGSVEERLDITVRKLDRVVNISQQIIDFCRSRGVDRRRAFFAGLCMEEMAGNVVEHGFSKDKREHSVDIRVVHSEEEIILRIRDNCRPFNPSERLKLMEPGEDGKNVGIRLVYGIARDVNYQNLLGLNVLTIRL